MTTPADASSRRDFLKTAAVGGTLASTLSLAGAVQTGSSDTLRVGLVGCGGRGTGAAAQALTADPNVKLTAMADAFEDRLEASLKTLLGDDKIAKKIDVPKDRRFVGFDGYQKVIDNVDVVLLATPPHFRPLHLRAAVDARKHVFAEKPVAVDAPGVRSVLASCADAKKKGLSVVSGLCLRYDYGFQETVKRIHDGALGNILAVQANDLRSRIWVKPRQPGMTDMEYQMRNWYYYTWLSGDFNVEQHVHYLDVCAWLLGDYPASAVALGGRQVRTGPEFGHIFDHHAVVYELASGQKIFSFCRQQVGCKNDMAAYVMGSRGTALVSERGLSITAGDSTWRYRGRTNNMYQTEHDELFAAIRKGKPINNGEYMCKSTLLAIMGRMASYTGKLITWEQALESKEDLSPPQYSWDVKLPEPPVAKPGQTPFV